MIWHGNNISEIAQELSTDIQVGLTEEQAAARLLEYGPNQLKEGRKKTFIQRFLEQFKGFMVIVLMIAAAISLVLTIVSREYNWIEPIAIVVIIILGALLGAIQESKAETALDALKSMAAPATKRLRDGIVTVSPATELVPGDIILLDAGDFIPADARLLEAADLRCDESALTGESMPVEKDAGALLAESAPLGDRVNMVHSGCVVTYGRGRALVTETGMQTQMGKIASMLEDTTETVTPLQKRLADLGKTLAILALVVCGVILIYGVITGTPFFTMFMTAVSLAVAAIPEGLPAIVTIVLAIGVQRMVKKNAIIRVLPAVETLGGASVICSDKTGTLTQNRMTLTELSVAHHPVDLTDHKNQAVIALLRLAVLCNDGIVEQNEDGSARFVGDPTETAILEAAIPFGIEKAVMEREYPRVAELPFDSDRKLMTTVNFIDGQNVAIVKGAPDVLLSRCTEGDIEAASKLNEEMASRALRVLAIGYKNLAEIPLNPTPEDLENGLHFAGLVGMIDPPRPEVIDAIHTCQTAGIRTIMITGDHITTATAIARQIGLLTEGQEAITGAELSAMSDEEYARDIRKYAVYARVSPEDKIRIVKAWQAAGEVVAMTGDGVNDAPALKAADIGCAMGVTGTDVAKGTADMILTDDNFATIVSAVREGRGIFDDIRKSVHFLLSCNLGEVIAVFAAMLIWRETPLLPVQLLLINLVTDSAPALALGMDPPEFDAMRRPPRPKNQGIFAEGMGVTAVLQGVMLGAITIFAYALGRTHFFAGASDPALGQTMAFAVLALSQLFHAFNVRSRHSIFRINPFSNKFMWGAFALSAGILAAVCLLEPLRNIFGLIPLPLHEIEWILGLSLSAVALVEIAKFFAWAWKKLRGPDAGNPREGAEDHQEEG